MANETTDETAKTIDDVKYGDLGFLFIDGPMLENIT